MKRQNKLSTYLTVTAGVGCASSVANAQTIVATQFSAPLSGPSFMSSNNIIYGGIDRYFSFGSQVNVNADNAAGTYFFRNSGATGPIDSANNEMVPFAFYGYAGETGFGAVFGTDNFISFDFADPNSGNTVEAVAQFSFDFAGNGFLVAFASNPDGSALSLDDGIAAIQGVPEPSSIALLALGSMGLAARRSRKKSA